MLGSVQCKQHWFDFCTLRQSIRPSDPERLATQRPEVACQLLRAFTLDASGTVLVSEQVHGTTSVDEALLRHHGSGVHLPLRTEWRLAAVHLEWHGREVFKGEARRRS